MGGEDFRDAVGKESDVFAGDSEETSHEVEEVARECERKKQKRSVTADARERLSERRTGMSSLDLAFRRSLGASATRVTLKGSEKTP